MRSWDDYKKTFPEGPDLFELARTGDLRGLASLLSEHPATNLEQRNPRGYSALMLAVYRGQHDFAEALLRAGVHPDSPDSSDNTTLMAAAFKGDEHTLALLLRFGADIKATNHVGMNALDWASTFGRKAALQYLQNAEPEGRGPRSRLWNLGRLLQMAFRGIRSKRTHSPGNSDDP